MLRQVVLVEISNFADSLGDVCTPRTICTLPCKQEFGLDLILICMIRLECWDINNGGPSEGDALLFPRQGVNYLKGYLSQIKDSGYYTFTKSKIINHFFGKPIVMQTFLLLPLN